MPAVARCAGALLLIAVCLAPAGCTSVRFDEDLAAYAATIEDLEGRPPDDPRALRDLGIIYLRTGHFARANDLLTRAFALDEDDPKTLYHVGLANEALAKESTALRVYGRYRDVPRLSPYRRLMAGRYADLTRRRLEDDVRQRLTNEQGLAAELDPRAMAVYPFVFQGGDAQYEALGRGLAELLSVDLSNVSSLHLVERARLQTLLDELALAESAYFDAATAPRVGRLVGAGRLVGGAYAVLGDGTLRLDGALWQAGAAAPALPALSDGLANFFALEKRLVFDVLDALSVTLSPQEEQRIEAIPTQDLQAFLAFSRGLEREDAGAFGEAAGFYAQAARLDPGFEMAQDYAEAAEGRALAAGPLPAALVAAARLDPSLPVPLVPGLDPVASRLLMLNSAIGAGLVPGLDAREPAAEAAARPVIVAPPLLPDPPDPPDQR